MLSLRTLLAAVAIFVSSVQADYVIDPNSVSLTTRTSWCDSEKATCPLICEQTPPGGYQVNSCDPTTLTYGCVCANGLQPNISEYSLTLPYFTCQEWGNQCVTACGSDSACASACRQDHPCGAQNPTKANTTSSSTASATASGASATDSNQIYTGLAGSSATSTPGSGAARMDMMYGSLSFGLLLGSLFCVGGMLL